MNKGLKIRNNKLKKKAVKRNTVKPEQEDVCRFITIKYQVITRVNGKYKHTGSETASGLQIRNRVYLQNGKYKLINNKGLKIIKKFEDIPEWSTEELTNKYKKFLGL